MWHKQLGKEEFFYWGGDAASALPVTNGFGYNPRSEVTNAVMGANAYGYAYNPIGNRKQSAIGNGQSADVTVYAANNLNQYFIITNSAFSASPREISPTYDLNGNLTYDGTNAYFWDLQNQLILVSNFQFQVSNTYDAMGRRVKKIVSRRDAETQSWNVECTCHFFYDGWNVIRETIAIGNQQSAVTNRYVWGNDLSGTLQGAGGVGGLLAVSISSSTNSLLSPVRSQRKCRALRDPRRNGGRVSTLDK